MNATTEKSSGVRVYTAHEMREMALCVDRDVFSDGRGNFESNGFMGFDPDAISSMLRQAADMMDKLPSVIESRLGRAEKRQKHDIANELFDCLSWTVGDKPEAWYANPEKLGKLWKRLRRESDEIESEWEEPTNA